MNNKDKGLANIGIGMCALAFGSVDLLAGSSSRPTGRWSLIFGPLFDAFGPSGPAAASMVIGLILVVFGFILRGKK